MSDLQGGNGRGALPLVVTDVPIPAEPPDDILYTHKAKLRDSVRVLWDHREIVYTLAERDFRAQYKQASLGVLWAVLSPVATLAIFVIVFSRVKAFPTGGSPTPSTPSSASCAGASSPARSGRAATRC